MDADTAAMIAVVYLLVGLAVGAWAWHFATSDTTKEKIHRKNPAPDAMPPQLLAVLYYGAVTLAVALVTLPWPMIVTRKLLRAGKGSDDR